MTMFINIVIKSKTIGLCNISLALCLLLYATTPITNTAVGYLFDPFSYKNAVEVVAELLPIRFFRNSRFICLYPNLTNNGKNCNEEKDMN